ncbi:MAG: NAD(P)-dependent oxidoreductase [Halobacteriales archaeon]
MARVLVTHSDTHPVLVDRFTDALDNDVEVVTHSLPAGGIYVGESGTLIDALAGCDALFMRPGNITGEVIRATDLEIIAVHGSGYDHVDTAAASQHGVLVTHNPEAPAPGVVEHVFGLIVTMLRNLPERMELTAAGRWADAREMVGELGQQTLGVVGLGTIGFAIAKRAREAFGATVLGYDPYVTGDREDAIYPRYDRKTVESAGIELSGFEALLDRADIVTLHVPKTAETTGMIGAAELDRLEGSYLINTSRGGVVDETALLGAVRRDALAGVGLDVMATEPPDSDDPLLGQSNVFVTPHIASATQGYLERAAENGAAKIQAVLDGQRPSYLVNPDTIDD